MGREAKLVRKSIFEMRYAPDPSFIDKRGAILNRLFKDEEGKQLFTHWKMDNQRVDVFEPDADRVGFASFRNAGFHVEHQPSPNFFREQVTKHMGVVARGLGLTTLKRIGVRIGVARETNAFEDAVKKIVKTFFRSDDSRFRELVGELKDIQALPFVCEEGRYQFRISAGVMKKAEYEEMGLFNKIDGLPEISYWMDTDYSTTDFELGREPEREIGKFLEHAESRILKKLELFHSMIDGGR